MIRAKDTIVFVALAWFLLRNREETSVTLEQTCIFPDGSTVRVPLGSSCPGASVLLTESPPYVPPIGDPQRSMRGYGCGCGNCPGCS